MTTRMRRIATFAAAALLMASCQRMELDQIPSTENDLIEFTFSKPVTSRAQINPNGSGSFEEGDCVGLYVGTNPARYYRLTLQNGVWTPGIPRHELGERYSDNQCLLPGPVRNRDRGNHIPPFDFRRPKCRGVRCLRSAVVPPHV